MEVPHPTWIRLFGIVWRIILSSKRMTKKIILNRFGYTLFEEQDEWGYQRRDSQVCIFKAYN